MEVSVSKPTTTTSSNTTKFENIIILLHDTQDILLPRVKGINKIVLQQIIWSGKFFYFLIILF